MTDLDFSFEDDFLLKVFNLEDEVMEEKPDFQTDSFLS